MCRRDVSLFTTYARQAATATNYVCTAPELSQFILVARSSSDHASTCLYHKLQIGQQALQSLCRSFLIGSHSFSRYLMSNMETVGNSTHLRVCIHTQSALFFIIARLSCLFLLLSGLYPQSSFHCLFLKVVFCSPCLLLSITLLLVTSPLFSLFSVLSFLLSLSLSHTLLSNLVSLLSIISPLPSLPFSSAEFAHFVLLKKRCILKLRQFSQWQT